MPPKKQQNPSGLGKALINRKVKDAQYRRETGNYTTDIDATTRLQSVTQERDLDEFLNTAQLAGTDFTAEKQNIRVVQAPTVGVSSAHNPFLLSAQDEKQLVQRHGEHKERLRVPRRPPWTKGTTTVQLDRQERDAFLEWRRGLAELSEKEELLLTPFERNIEVWRQLWRVLERSHLVVQIVDARNPLKFRCEDLESYVKDIEGSEGEKGTGKGKRRTLLLVNKADLLTKAQRTTWADYFDANNVRFAFYSAANASALQEKLLQNENGERQEGSDTPDGQSGTETSGPETSEPSTDSEPEVGAINEVQDESDERIRVLSVQELEELFIKTAPPLSDFTDSEGKSPTKLTVGLVGYPNVGKSSTINSLLGAKKVSVSSTPGKTKHFQTIHLSPDLLLCDCPGLVFPQFATTKAELVCDGVLPIDQMREYRGPVVLVTQRISRPVLEATYGLTLRRRGEEEGGDGSDAVLAEDLLVAYAIARGYARAGQGNPDESRAARYILKDYVNAKLLYCHPPPDADGREFNNETSEIRLRKMLGRKRAPVTRVGKGADTAPDVSHVLDKNESLETEEPAPIQSNKSRTLDREFFDSQAIGSRPYVKGGSRDGHGITRVRLYPHQNSVADDGRPLGAKAAKVASVLEASGLQGPGSDKKHYKMKRGKQRSGKGYD